MYLFCLLVCTFFCHSEYSGVVQNRPPQKNSPSPSPNLIPPPKDKYEDLSRTQKISPKLYLTNTQLTEMGPSISTGFPPLT